MRSHGKCCYCGLEGTQTVLKKHFMKCGPFLEAMKQGDTRYFILRAEDVYNSNYWIYVTMRSNSQLLALDSFLRKIWLECCGHTSGFTRGEDGNKIHITTKVEDIFPVAGQKLLANKRIFYQYDFSNTTSILINCMGLLQAANRKNAITLLARNLPKEYMCSCGNVAEYICPECQYGEENPYFCGECAKTHLCGEDILLPVVNSPRMGVCRYTGKWDGIY